MIPVCIQKYLFTRYDLLSKMAFERQNLSLRHLRIHDTTTKGYWYGLIEIIWLAKRPAALATSDMGVASRDYQPNGGVSKEQPLLPHPVILQRHKTSTPNNPH